MLNDNIAAWYKEYFPFVYRRCMAILRNHEDAESCAHNVFEKLQRLKAEGRLEIRSAGGPGGLLCVMAGNMSRNQLRERRRETCRFYAMATNVSLNRIREKNMGAGEILSLLKTGIPPETLRGGEHVFTDENFERVEAELLVKAVLEGEDEKTRDICFMSYRDKMTLEQIGEAVGLKKSAVGKRLKNLEKTVRLKLRI